MTELFYAGNILIFLDHLLQRMNHLKMSVYHNVVKLMLHVSKYKLVRISSLLEDKECAFLKFDFFVCFFPFRAQQCLRPGSPQITSPLCGMSCTSL